jgi:methionyl-tRNA synthetase
MAKTLITAALPYANGPVHIGHLAGVYIPADIYARFQRLMGEEVLFVCGSDEHGVPITMRARKEGITPQDVVDRYHAIIGKSFADLGISFDIYSRTSSSTHKEMAQDFFKNLLDKGVFEEIKSEQYFDDQEQQFLADRYILGTCPKCSNSDAYGDQCEKCGSTLSPSELISPRSALSGTPPQLKETTNWYLPLGQIQEVFLNDWIHSKTNWKSNVLGQCKSWLNDGLKSRAMTRDLDWGIPVPVADADGKVLYVWFEAPIGYISATKEKLPEDWQSWWTGDSKLIHFIGKDNIVFHCIIFPAMLHLRGDGYVVPTQVPANEFLNLEGQKISTSRNWAVWLNEYLEELPNRKDELRYVLTSIAPETKDSEFTWKDFQTRVNSELVGILGNFANRVMVLMHKYYQGTLPEVEVMPQYLLEKTSATILGVAYNLPSPNTQFLYDQYIVPVKQLLSDYRFRDAQFAFMELARLGNKFLADLEPWKLVKTDEKATAFIMQQSTDLLLNIAVLMEPFMPEASQRLLKQLAIGDVESLKNKFWLESKWLTMTAGQQLNPAELLFQKIEDDVVDFQIQKLQSSLLLNSVQKGAINSGDEKSKEGDELANSTVNSQTNDLVKESASASGSMAGNSGLVSDGAGLAELKPLIEFPDFAKIDLRVGTVTACEKVEKADKLLKLTVDLGETEPRTIVSGIAMHFTPDEVVGNQVVVVANLAPRKMRGIESEGMILMAEDATGKLVFVSPKSMVNSGSGVS